MSESSRYSGRPNDKKANFHWIFKEKKPNQLGMPWCPITNQGKLVVSEQISLTVSSGSISPKTQHTFKNSSSGTCNFFWIRALTSANVSPSWMIKKNGSPKFWTCCQDPKKLYKFTDQIYIDMHTESCGYMVPLDSAQSPLWNGKHESGDHLAPSSFPLLESEI